MNQSPKISADVVSSNTKRVTLSHFQSVVVLQKSRKNEHWSLTYQNMFIPDFSSLPPISQEEGVFLLVLACATSLQSFSI